MKLYAGVTDQDWFDYLRSQPDIDEVNFWQPSPRNQFRALQRGDLFLFKLHKSPRTRKGNLKTTGTFLRDRQAILIRFSFAYELVSEVKRWN